MYDSTSHHSGQVSDIGDMGPDTCEGRWKGMRPASAIGEQDITIWHGHRKGRVALLYRRCGTLIDRDGRYGQHG